MKPVLMIIDEDAVDGILFGTVAEAQAYAESLTENKTFDIFTLYSEGVVAKIEWTLKTDHATNLREVKKKAAPRSTTVWSDLEIKTLVHNYKEKVPIGEIAKSLNRTYNACYSKLVQQKAFVPVPRT